MEQRVRALNQGPINPRGRCVIYWMERAQRAKDNLALVYAIEQANSLLKPLVCYFAVDESLPMSSPRSLTFIFSGIKETAAELEKRGVPFVSRIESPADGIQRMELELDPCLVVVEEALVGYERMLRERAAARLAVSLLAVDSEAVVPMRAWQGEIANIAQMKRRASLLWRRHPPEIATPKLRISGQKIRVPKRIELAETEVMSLVASSRLHTNVVPSPLLQGGPKAAEKRLHDFVRRGLAAYPGSCTEPGLDGGSGLSPYLHFGQIWAGRVALEVQRARAPEAAKKAFLENLLIWRELAMNFCCHHPDHDSPVVMAAWAKETLDSHRADPRPTLYRREELETASTQDPLWNAAQRELLAAGRIPPSLRPLWAKKIMQWSASPEEAWEAAIYLNDKYALDGRDANGYFNIARCLGGVHEKPARERPIFGRLPYLASEQFVKKINFGAYLERVRRTCRLAGLEEESPDTNRSER